jgi:hypothetical protein
MVPLRDTIEETVSSMKPKLRLRLRGLMARSTMRLVTEPAEAAQLHRTMLEPFARARHEARAVLVPEAEVVRLAREAYLGEVSLDGTPVGAFTGQTYRRGGQRSWEALRVGYSEPVSADPRRLSDANAVLFQWTMQLAIEHGHRVFDLGTSPARPEGGLMQFKRRRGGGLSHFACSTPAWLLPPRQGVDAFFWRWPLFSLEPGGPVLHLGVPPTTSDTEVLARLESLTFGGLEAVRLHPGRAVSPGLLDSVRALFDSPTGAMHGKGSARRVESRCWSTRGG